ncbi:MAG: hypothetical protein DME82_05300 [Verrucomicrobia bacterium]|nr:MAG: hypothetical protein DME82_05300 [Verrucomicrobiota bacterium]
MVARVIALPLILTHPGNQKTILGDLGRERLPKFRLSGNHVATGGAFALKQRFESPSPGVRNTSRLAVSGEALHQN